jgi:hypothetical protein
VGVGVDLDVDVNADVDLDVAHVECDVDGAVGAVFILHRLFGYCRACIQIFCATRRDAIRWRRGCEWERENDSLDTVLVRGSSGRDGRDGRDGCCRKGQVSASDQRSACREGVSAHGVSPE